MWRQIHWTHLSTWPLSKHLFDSSLHSWILLEKISFTPYVFSELGMDNSNCTITSNAKRTDAPFKRTFFFFLFYRLSKMSFIFLLIGCAILKKTFHTFLAQNSPVENSTGDVMTFGWVESEFIFDTTPETAYVNHFFPLEFLVWFKSIHAK